MESIMYQRPDGIRFLELLRSDIEFDGALYRPFEVTSISDLPKFWKTRGGGEIKKCYVTFPELIGPHKLDGQQGRIRINRISKLRIVRDKTIEGSSTVGKVIIAAEILREVLELEMNSIIRLESIQIFAMKNYYGVYLEL